MQRKPDWDAIAARAHARETERSITDAANVLLWIALALILAFALLTVWQW